MPEIKITAGVTPEQFAEACNQSELHELDAIMASPWVRQRLNHAELFPNKKPARSKQQRAPEA